MKKIKERENVYYDIEGNEVYDANIRKFLINVTPDIQALLLECIDKRISIKGVSNTRLDYETLLMLIKEGVMCGVSDIEVWKIANSGFTPEVMEWALNAAKKGIYFVNVEFGTRVNPKIFMLASRAADYGIDMTDKITPLSTIENFRRDLKIRLFLKGKIGLFKQIDMRFATKEEIAGRTIESQM